MSVFFLCTPQVSGSETLASIAAKFDTTTSELKKLNKLMTQMIWPGQVGSIFLFLYGDHFEFCEEKNNILLRFSEADIF